jgi:hypothetical protein
MDTETEYHYYKVDFMSAYKANGKNVDLALAQVANLRKIEKEHLKTVLRKLIKKLKNE